MARRGPTKPWQLVLLLIIAVVVWALDQQRKTPAAGKSPSQKAPTAGYEVISGCRWQDHKSNDGDSFHVRLPDGRVEQFRLYYVDAPESQFRSYGGGRTNRERIHEQAQEMGLSDEQAVEIGQRAKSRAHDLLAGKPFTLHTRWDDPFGDRRYHAFVAPEGGPFLEETLVREGLVRIRTKPADLPDGTPVKERLRQLRDLEKEAKQAKRGAWGW
ncbi:thermonuclease family protein [Luteolibacter arcticus]|uniref:Thermonuclease family protein n=1 Tax=Luteolibacter arcticus TaxID=1581411 RepID=A0ABT3GF62_9BACT|nr:thermonuclease family protein [Luteolibacter arcticus]MCW1922247.1 thermonuclease family protein [Luteolibacter arcticus]